jgi:hypothetical protein
VVTNKNNKADITSIINIVVINELEKKMNDSQKQRESLVIIESKASLDEK